MKLGKTIKVYYKNGNVLSFGNIDEYVAGFRYLYIKHLDTNTVLNTISIPRDIIDRVERLYSNGKVLPVHLKKAPTV